MAEWANEFAKVIVGDIDFDGVIAATPSDFAGLGIVLLRRNPRPGIDFT